MTTLTEARKVTLALSQFAATLPQSLNFISFNIATINAYLDSQVAESQEVVELRARLAREEGFVRSATKLAYDQAALLMQISPCANHTSFVEKPIPLRCRMTLKASGQSYEAYSKAGWTDIDLIAFGYMEVNRDVLKTDFGNHRFVEINTRRVDPSQMEDGAIGRPG